MFTEKKKKIKYTMQNELEGSSSEQKAAKLPKYQ